MTDLETCYKTGSGCLSPTPSVFPDLLVLLCKVRQEITVTLASSETVPSAWAGVCQHLLALSPPRKLTSEAGEGLAAGRDQGAPGELPGCKLSRYENK